MRLAHLRLAVELPSGWDGRIYRRLATAAGSTTHPVLHAATFPLPEERGDYGSGAVERMRTGDLFVALLEFDPEAAATPLFAWERPPALLPEYFSPDALQRVIPGQGGAQFFFSEWGRAFCLYVVLGSYAARTRLVPRADALYRTLAIG